MIDYNRLYAELAEVTDQATVDGLRTRIGHALAPERNGHHAAWQAALERLPSQTALDIDLARPSPRIGAAVEISPAQRTGLEEALHALGPWRKGPFDVFGVNIDAEWRSDLKWQRVQPHIQPLEDRRVLDVGCGNGYYALRMLGAGAARIVGVDPTLLYIYQFEALRRLLPPIPIDLLPLGLEDISRKSFNFDTVFSMGVLYHRRCPMEHLAQLYEVLRPGGELVVESLVVEGVEGYALMPDDRYAKMRNVWFIPSVPTLASWLRRSRFTNIRTVDITPTTMEEQRKTPWSSDASLRDFLALDAPDKTVEGYPAPVRAVMIAERGWH